VAAPGTVQAWRNLADVEAVVLHFWIEERLPLASPLALRFGPGIAAGSAL
jgi:hypothetical protein